MPPKKQKEIAPEDDVSATKQPEGQKTVKGRGAKPKQAESGSAKRAPSGKRGTRKFTKKANSSDSSDDDSDDDGDYGAYLDDSSEEAKASTKAASRAVKASRPQTKVLKSNDAGDIKEEAKKQSRASSAVIAGRSQRNKSKPAVVRSLLMITSNSWWMTVSRAMKERTWRAPR